MIKAGASVPSVPVKLINAGGVTDADTAAMLSSGRIVLFTLPGAYTPTCSNNHLPGYLALADELKAAGLDRLVCATVNDHHVTKAWAESTGALGKIEFIADGNADFARAVGLDKDMSDRNMSIRYIRAAIIINNGRVEAVYTEDVPGQVTSSGAPAILGHLKERVV